MGMDSIFELHNFGLGQTPIGCHGLAMGQKLCAERRFKLALGEREAWFSW